jgi:antitoxin VapB
MASLYIKDHETADLVRRVAARSGKTNTALIRELAKAREEELDHAEPTQLTPREKLEKFWRDHPRPRPAPFVADKAFFDNLYD